MHVIEMASRVAHVIVDGLAVRIDLCLRERDRLEPSILLQALEEILEWEVDDHGNDTAGVFLEGQEIMDGERARWSNFVGAWRSRTGSGSTASGKELRDVHRSLSIIRHEEEREIPRDEC